MKTQFIEIMLHIHRETQNAVLVSEDNEDNTKRWLPKSQVKGKDGENIDNVLQDVLPGQAVEIQVAQWLAKKEALI